MRRVGNLEISAKRRALNDMGRPRRIESHLSNSPSERSIRLERPGGRAGLRIAAPAFLLQTALGLPQIVEGNLRGLSDKPDFPTLPTPGKAEVHETFERLVSLFGRGNRRVD